MAVNDSSSADESNPLLQNDGSSRPQTYSNLSNDNESIFSLWYWMRILYNVSIHIALGAITCFVTYICFYKGTVLFSWHPTLMLIGFLVLMTEAMLCFEPINLPTRKLSYKSRVFIHWMLQIISTCAITASFTIIIVNKIRISKNHFTSNHGIVGLTTVILTGISLGFGILAKYSHILRDYLRPINMKMIHSGMAMCCYILAMTTISLGLLSPWFLENVSYSWIYGLIGVVIFIGQYALLKPFLGLSKKIAIRLRG